MAKTVFANGSILTPTFCNAQFGTTAATGHVHDGTDVDGHQPKILLTAAAQVQGYLPSANVVGLDGETERGTFDAIFPSGKTLIVSYRKYSGVIPLIKIFWPDLSGLTSDTSHVAAGTPVPVSIRPTNNRIVATIEYGNAGVLGDIRMLASGGMQFNSLTVTTTIDSKVVEYVL